MFLQVNVDDCTCEEIKSQQAVQRFVRRRKKHPCLYDGIVKDMRSDLDGVDLGDAAMHDAVARTRCLGASSIMNTGFIGKLAAERDRAGAGVERETTRHTVDLDLGDHAIVGNRDRERWRAGRRSRLR